MKIVIKTQAFLMALILMTSSAFAGELNYSWDDDVVADYNAESPQSGGSNGSAGWLMALIVIGAVGFMASEYIADQEEAN